MNTLPDDIGPRLRDSLNRGAAPELSTDVVTGAATHAAPRLTNPRRSAQLAGGATALVALVAVATLVVGPGLNRAPLFTEAAATATAGRAGVSASANVPAVNDLMRIWADYHYHAGVGLSRTGGSGDVYQLTRSGTGTKRAVALAADFGLAGEKITTDNSDAANPVFTIGAIDGSTPALYLTWSGTGDWSYSDQSAYRHMACPSTDNTGGASSGPVSAPACFNPPQPAGPNNAPTGAEARSRAQKLFADTGLDVAAQTIQLMSDSSQTTATASLVVGGVKTALDWGVTWSSTGKIGSAYGHSISKIDRGSYGTVSAADAVQRLGDSRWYGSAGPAYQGGVRRFAADGVGPGNATGSPTDQPSTAPTDAPTDSPTNSPSDVATPDPTPTGPPIIDVTISKAESTLLLMWDSRGGAWLVPGYAMRVGGGWWSSVVSLAPGVIELPPVPTVEPDGGAPAVGNPGTTN